MANLKAVDSETWDHIGHLHRGLSEIKLALHERDQREDAKQEGKESQSMGAQIGKGLAAAIHEDAIADKALAQKVDQLASCLDRLDAHIVDLLAGLKVSAAQQAQSDAGQVARHEEAGRRHAELMKKHDEHIKTLKMPRKRTGEVQLPSGRVAMTIREE